MKYINNMVEWDGCFLLIKSDLGVGSCPTAVFQLF